MVLTFSSGRSQRLLWSVLLVLFCVGNAHADVVASPPVIPENTKVLILPSLDITADRPEMQQAHIVTGNHRLAYEFLIRGFNVLAPEVGQRAARLADIDLTAPEERSRKSLKQLGELASADWVVALSIDDVREIRTGNWLPGGGRRAKAKVEIRVWDVKAGAYLTNKFFEATKSTKRLIGNIGTTGLFRQAIDTTVQRSIQDVLSYYPVIEHKREQFDETDVVTGEVASGLEAGPDTDGPILGAGTPIIVVVDSTFRSDNTRDGDPVVFHVKDDIFSTEGSHTLFVAKNAVAMGRIIVAKRREYAGGAGKLQFTCDYVTAVDGKRVYLRSAKIGHSGRSNEGGAIALAAVVSTLGLLISGTDAKVDAGTAFTLYVDQNATIGTVVPVSPTASVASAAVVTPAPVVLPDANPTPAPAPKAPEVPVIPVTVPIPVVPAAPLPVAAPAPPAPVVPVTPAPVVVPEPVAPAPVPATPAAPTTPPGDAPAAEPSIDATMLSLLGTNKRVLLHLKNMHIVVGAPESYNGKSYTLKASNGTIDVLKEDIASVSVL